MREGTGRGVYRYLADDFDVAGKTGTTNDGRDSWFAGFSGDLLAVSWIGRDDNGGTGLTGSSGALKVWATLYGAAPVSARWPTGCPTVLKPTGLMNKVAFSLAKVAPMLVCCRLSPALSRASAPIVPARRQGSGLKDWFESLFGRGVNAADR